MSRLMIIPAAGVGSRLGSSLPKVLSPVNGRPMVDYLFDLYHESIDVFILVVHPSFERLVRDHCAGKSFRIEIEKQHSPTGMLDAILIPQELVTNHHPRTVWVTWCDQIAVHPETVRRLRALSDEDSEASLIFPTVKKVNPYTHLVRNAEGDILALLHRREGDPIPERGESEMGLFCLSLDAYLRLLPQFSRDLKQGAETRERNFLPFIPWLHGEGRVVTFPAKEEIEALGINTPEDLNHIEVYFRYARTKTVHCDPGL